MDVSVDEAGQQHLAGDVDDLGASPDERPHRLAAQGGDSAVAHGHRVGPGPGGVNGVHGPVDEYGVGRPAGWRALLWSACRPHDVNLQGYPDVHGHYGKIAAY